jgi:ribonuclease E
MPIPNFDPFNSVAPAGSTPAAEPEKPAEDATPATAPAPTKPAEPEKAPEPAAEQAPEKEETVDEKTTAEQKEAPAAAPKKTPRKTAAKKAAPKKSTKATGEVDLDASFAALIADTDAALEKASSPADPVATAKQLKHLTEALSAEALEELAGKVATAAEKKDVVEKFILAITPTDDQGNGAGDGYRVADGAVVYD